MRGRTRMHLRDGDPIGGDVRGDGARRGELRRRRSGVGAASVRVRDRIDVRVGVASTKVASEFASFDRAEVLSVSEAVRFEGPGYRPRRVASSDRVTSAWSWPTCAGRSIPMDRVRGPARRSRLPGADLRPPWRVSGRRARVLGGKTGDIGWEDLGFAVDLLRARGASRVVVGGASLGAMESLYALTRGLDATGSSGCPARICTGRPVTDQVRAVRVPKLLATGEFDSDAVELRPEVERAASPPNSLLLDTGEHGTNILEFGDPAVADVFRRSVLDFLATI